MKKLILICAAGLFLFVITKNEGLNTKPSFQYKSAFEKTLETQLPQATSETKVLSSKKSPSLTYDDLEKKFYKLEAREVEKMLDDLEVKLQSSNLLALANERKLTSDEKEEMLLIIRTKAALTKVLIEKTYEEHL